MYMTNKEKERQEEMIFERLPEEARIAVKSNPDKQAKVDKIIQEIYREYGEEISALAKN